jgi:hypothetical protein
VLYTVISHHHHGPHLSSYLQPSQYIILFIIIIIVRVAQSTSDAKVGSSRTFRVGDHDLGRTPCE